MQKGFSSVIILIIILLSAGIVGAYYFGKLSNKSTQSPPPQTQTPQPTPAPSPTSDETANWEIYESSPEFGYSFKYPSNFWITSVETNLPDKAAQADAPPPPKGTGALISLKQSDINPATSLEVLVDNELKKYLNYPNPKYQILINKPVLVGPYTGKYLEIKTDNSVYLILLGFKKSSQDIVLWVQNMDGSAGTSISKQLLESSVDQILSTFKFLDQNQTEDRAKCTKDEDCTVDRCSCEPINKAYQDDSKISCALACPGRAIKCTNNRCVVIQ